MSAAPSREDFVVLLACVNLILKGVLSASDEDECAGLFLRRSCNSGPRLEKEWYEGVGVGVILVSRKGEGGR